MEESKQGMKQTQIVVDQVLSIEKILSIFPFRRKHEIVKDVAVTVVVVAVEL